MGDTNLKGFAAVTAGVFAWFGLSILISFFLSFFIPIVDVILIGIGIGGVSFLLFTWITALQFLIPLDPPKKIRVLFWELNA